MSLLPNPLAVFHLPEKHVVNTMHYHIRETVNFSEETENGANNARLDIKGCFDVSASCHGHCSAFASSIARTCGGIKRQAFYDTFAFNTQVSAVRLGMQHEDFLTYATSGSLEADLKNRIEGMTAVWDCAVNMARKGGSISIFVTDSLNNSGTIRDHDAFIAAMVDNLPSSTLFVFVQIGIASVKANQVAFASINEKLAAKYGPAVAGCQYVDIDAPSDKLIESKMAPVYKYFRKYMENRKETDFVGSVDDPYELNRIYGTMFVNQTLIDYAPNGAKIRAAIATSQDKGSDAYMKYCEMKQRHSIAGVHGAQQTIDHQSQAYRVSYLQYANASPKMLNEKDATPCTIPKEAVAEPTYARRATVDESMPADAQPSSMDVPGSFCFRAINPDPNFDELEKLLQPYGGVVLRLLVPEPEAEEGEGKWKMLVKFRTQRDRDLAKVEFTTGTDGIWVKALLGATMYID